VDRQQVYILRSYNLGADGEDSQNDIVTSDKELFIDLLSKIDLDDVMQRALFEVWDNGHLLSQSQVFCIERAAQIDNAKLCEYARSFINSIQD
jgi:hypothetical protein